MGEDGELKKVEEDKAKIIRDFFSKLFTSSEPGEDIVRTVVNMIQERLTGEDYHFLNRTFEEREVKEALFDMHPTKAPDPDGFNARFFQKFWPEIGEEVSKEVLDILNNEKPIKEWNESLLCLIPKVKDPKTVAEFRPLSLCNTMYKMVSKVIANRLRQVMDHIIDPTQSAFIKGRLITDNILVSFECQHWLRKKKKGKKGYAVVKLDMSKAYDRVEWNYLEAL